MPKRHDRNREFANGALSLSAVLYGMAHTLDLGANMVQDRGRFNYVFGAASDARAIRGDWQRAIRNSAQTVKDGKKP